MKPKIDLKFLLEKNFVRKVDDKIVPNLHLFELIIHMTFTNLNVFYYAIQAEEDLIVLRRENFYMEQPKEFYHQQNITIYQDMTLVTFKSLFEEQDLVEA